MIRTLWLFILTFSSCCLFAADTVIVHKDARLDLLTIKQAGVNRLNAKMTGNGQYRGYRLQVLNSRSRDEAFKIKADLLQLFPDQKSYMLYQSPYFKVRIGNFIERTEALAFRNKLMQAYPQNVYVVEDIIEYKPGEDEEPVTN